MNTSKLRKNKETPFELANKEYLLLINGTPVSSIYAIHKNEKVVDITVTTLPKNRKKGYAKKAIQLVEEKIFANPKVFFATITDITKEKISSKIAIALGYTYHEETNTFVKANPILEENITHQL